MLKFLFGRLAIMVPTLLLVTMIVFLLQNLLFAQYSFLIRQKVFWGESIEKESRRGWLQLVNHQNPNQFEVQNRYSLQRQLHLSEHLTKLP